MSGHCELCGETGGHSAACVSNPYQAANQRVIIATLTADLARLTAELNKRRAIEACDALADMPHDMLLTVAILQREELKADKAELERSRMECEGLLAWAESLEAEWLRAEQLALIKNGMKVEQARIHAETRLKLAKVAALSAGGSDGNS